VPLYCQKAYSQEYIFDDTPLENVNKFIEQEKVEIEKVLGPIWNRQLSEPLSMRQFLAQQDFDRRTRNIINQHVGYRPVIIWLPQGANFTTQVNVSGDRRYIRYSGSPMFSGISRVNTFSYQRVTP